MTELDYIQDIYWHARFATVIACNSLIVSMVTFAVLCHLLHRTTPKKTKSPPEPPVDESNPYRFP